MEYSKSLSINLLALDKAFSILHFMLVEVNNPAFEQIILYKSFRYNFLFFLWYLININSIVVKFTIFYYFYEKYYCIRLTYSLGHRSISKGGY